MLAGSMPAARFMLPQKPPVTSVRAYLNCGIVGTVICGCGSGGIFEALAIPLGSTVTLFRPPMLAGPGGIPLIGTFPIPASPAARANEAAGEATASRKAKATFAEMFDIVKLHR